MKPTHKISAVYYPFDDLIELTWENMDTYEVATLTAQVDRDDGEQITRVVSPCVYQYAISETKARQLLLEVIHVIDPDCPDSGAYIDGHCDIIEVLERKLQNNIV